ncbi:hypothetical protein SpiGrapes_1598 [Sphaerochaeta pleomorpha str. Grapes]|uniref:L-fucose isomerase family protein n=1 Tax=Sphaerochaeta pleomorpha (strain ATCC BAA-1885 / DSM 22778 / Grapes) TaxID=158190 RepID=G8QWA7_SPHPG|nr:hypothetical protein [Sphaerochaeta pleomorpha]AEV29405.1 hypothetical protein SpiGrapes_1598 [Sphaerochaeta pleomorpha str. Grapes]
MRPELVPTVGVLFITTPRFHDLGKGTEHGIYFERKEAEAKRILSDLSAFSNPVFERIVYSREDLQEAMDVFESRKVDMVFACFLSWSDDFAWIRFLRDMKPIPILFASLVRDSLGFSDSLNEDRFVEFLSAGSLVGMLEASGSASRFDRPMMKRAIGTLSDIMETCRTFALASAIRSKLKNTNFGLLPSFNKVMWSTYVDIYAFFMQVGPEIRFLSVLGLQQEIEALPAQEVAQAMEALLNQYDSDNTVATDMLKASVAASLALEHLGRKAGVEVLVLNDVDEVLLRTIGLRPGFTPCPGTDDIVIVPEGDVGGALATYILKLLSRKPVQFIEPFHIDQERDVFEAGHAGPNDYTDPMGKTLISRDERFAKTDYTFAGAPFAWHVIAEGQKTMLHISECNGTYKLVCSLIDALPTTHHLAGYTHGLFKPKKPCITFFQELMDIGITQHFAIAEGNYLKELEDIATIMRFEFHQI